MNDVLLNKQAGIERCIRQVRRYYQAESAVPFKDDFLRQDAIALNLQRAIEQAIDCANYVVKKRKLGLPQSAGHSFTLLKTEGIIDEATRQSMQGMVGFRNILVHQYQHLNLDIMVNVIENHLEDLIDFAHRMLKSLGQKS